MGDIRSALVRAEHAVLTRRPDSGFPWKQVEKKEIIENQAIIALIGKHCFSLPLPASTREVLKHAHLNLSIEARLDTFRSGLGITRGVYSELAIQLKKPQTGITSSSDAPEGSLDEISQKPFSALTIGKDRPGHWHMAFYENVLVQGRKQIPLFETGGGPTLAMEELIFTTLARHRLLGLYEIAGLERDDYLPRRRSQAQEFNALKRIPATLT